MERTSFLSLTDVVLLEVFTYLSCEEILYSFAGLHDLHLNDLLTEYGAFQRICLSSQLSRHQYKALSKGIWHYDLVRSFVAKECFSDFIANFTPCQIFPLLTHLQILCLKCAQKCVSQFVIAHSSTLKHFTVTRSEQSFTPDGYRNFLHTILPHLKQLTFLDTDIRSYVGVNWNQLAGRLQSLEHLVTFVPKMSDVYILAVDGVFPHLRSLRIHVDSAVIRTSFTQLSTTRRLSMPKLETFNLHLTRKNEDDDEESEEEEEDDDGDEIKWTDIETLTSYSVMPRLRRFSIIYEMLTSREVREISESSLFNNDDRHIDIRFALRANVLTTMNSYDISKIFNVHTSHYNVLFAQDNGKDTSKLHYTWFTSSWPSWTTFWMNNHSVIPYKGVRQCGINIPNVSIDLIGKLFPDTNKLCITFPASLSITDLTSTPTPLVNIRHLTVFGMVPGLEFLLDGVMLPHLHSLQIHILPLFVALVSRANQTKTLNTINHLVITDQNNEEEQCFSFKQWFTVLDALPRLQMLLVQIQNAKCPPMALADLFINYVKQTKQVSLNLFSCCIDDSYDMENKEHFITYIEERMEMVCSPVQLAIMGSTRFNAWF